MMDRPTKLKNYAKNGVQKINCPYVTITKKIKAST